jgi:hypothetical protein
MPLPHRVYHSIIPIKVIANYYRRRYTPNSGSRAIYRTPSNQRIVPSSGIFMPWGPNLPEVAQCPHTQSVLGRSKVGREVPASFGYSLPEICLGYDALSDVQEFQWKATSRHGGEPSSTSACCLLVMVSEQR